MSMRIRGFIKVMKLYRDYACYKSELFESIEEGFSRMAAGEPILAGIPVKSFGALI